MEEGQNLWTNLGGSEENVRVIAPGIVFFKNVLNEEQQLWLANYALGAGSDPHHGFWVTLPDGQKALNSDKGRGRIYDAIETFPEPKNIRDLCDTLVKAAQKRDDKMPSMQPTHLLLLYYATEEGMYWHSDSDKNDGDNNHPIVSITIGNSCDFGYKLFLSKEETLKLESGDVLIWGGPYRMLPHCVHKVYGHSSPEFLKPLLDKENVRLNFTFRDAPNALGREKDFKYDVDSTYKEVLEHLLTNKEN